MRVKKPISRLVGPADTLFQRPVTKVQPESLARTAHAQRRALAHSFVTTTVCAGHSPGCCSVRIRTVNGSVTFSNGVRPALRTVIVKARVTQTRIARLFGLRERVPITEERTQCRW